MARGDKAVRGGRAKVPGWDLDSSLKINSKPSELFPPYKVPIANPPTEKEKREAANYLKLREEIHQGPFYTKETRDLSKPSKAYGEEQDNERYDNRSSADTDPFNGVPRYTWKYDQKGRRIPQLTGRPFDKSLFPEELWSALEGEEGEAVRNTINKGLRKKAEMLFQSADTTNLTKRQKKVQTLIEKIKNFTEEDEVEAEADRDEDDDQQEEDADYDYEDDEAEMGGDYGAEQYFDGGEGDEDDGNDGGGGDEY